MNKDQIVVQSTSLDVVEAEQRAEYDIQISTAKKYPRNLKQVRDNCIAIATMDKTTAASCGYTLPRGGKSLSGPSVHLARIIVQQYGNVRAEARVKQITDKQIISEAICFDLETNYACKVEVRRSILNKTGKRFNDDMITVAGNAANAIAFRNAVFNVVPKAITESVYGSAIRMVTGDLSDNEKLIKERKRMVNSFINNYKITEEQLLNAMGLRSVNQIKAEEIMHMQGMIQALTDGDSTPEEMFQLKKSGDEKKKDLKDKKESGSQTEMNLP
jgi:hypothetical protein